MFGSLKLFGRLCLASGLQFSAARPTPRTDRFDDSKHEIAAVLDNVKRALEAVQQRCDRFAEPGLRLSNHAAIDAQSTDNGWAKSDRLKVLENWP